MKRRVAILLAGASTGLALLAPLRESAAGTRPEMPKMSVKLEEYNVNSKDFIFPSGLRVIMQADHSQPIVAITSVVDRGSTSDPLGKEGIAHFVEHLWFRSEHGDLPKVWNLLQELGCGGLNASTAPDWTNYMVVCPNDSLDALMKLESLRLTDAVHNVTQEVVDTEREVVRNELRMRYENSVFMAFPYLFERLYPPGHPYQRLGIGTHGSLNNIRIEDIQAFVKTNYRPENTTIVIVGDFDLDRAADLIFQNFEPSLLHPDLKPEHVQRFVRPGITDPDPENPDHWGWWALDPHDPTKALELQQGPTPRIAGEPPEPPEPYDTKPVRVKANIEYPTVFIAWTMPGAYHGNEGAMNIAANQAGDYMYSYFRDDTRVRKDDIFNQAQVGCGPWTEKLDTKIICSIEIKNADDGEAIAERAMDQLTPLWTQKFDVDPAYYAEFIEPAYQRAKASSLSGVLLSLDLISSLGGRATQISEHAHYTGSATYHSDLMNTIMEANPDEPLALAYKYLQRKRAVTIIVEPLDVSERVLDSSDAEYHGARRDDDIARSAIDPSLIDEKLVAENTRGPEIAKIRETTLSNGLRVVVMPHGEVPLAQVRMIYGGGSSTEPLGLDDYAREFSAGIYYKMDAKYDPLRIASTRLADSGGNYEYEGMEGSAGNVDGMMWLMREDIEARRPLFEGKASWLSFNKRVLKSQWDDPAWWDSKLTWETLAPNHVYSWDPGWDDYERWNKEWDGTVVRGYLDRKYQPANATLLVVGKVDPDATIETAKKYFESWTPATGAEVGPIDTVPPVPSAGPGRVMVFDDEKNTQTDVSFICPIAPRTPESRAAITILGEYASERAWTILREQSGVTYGASAGTSTYPGGFARLGMGSLVQNDSVVLAITAFRDIVTEVEQQKPDASRLKVIALNNGKTYVLDQQSMHQMSDRLMGVIAMRNSWQTLSDWGPQLGRVTAPDLTAALGDCSQHAVISLHGPKSVIGPALEGAGIAYEVVDWETLRDQMWEKHDPKGYKKMMKARAKKEAKEVKESGDATSSTG